MHQRALAWVAFVLGLGLIAVACTFDHLLGTFPGANGVSTGMAFGQPRTLTRGTDGRLPGDLPHGYTEALAA